MRFLSLFSGVEAASQAWDVLGWECVGFSEIEPHPCAVLAHRYPHVPNLGDVTKIGLCARYDPIRILQIAARYPASRLARYYTNLAQRVESLGPINLVVFGSPCQDLSVAGKRRGFTDHAGQLTRSGLFHVAIDIIRWTRRRWGARFALWENVPGAFTNNGGRDFAAVVDQMAGLEGTPVPPKGWGTEGCTVGAEAMVEWATLDAQWFGVAQRRRRVFALADFGDWTSRPPILLEPEGLRGHSAPLREAQPPLTAGALRSTDGGSDLEHARANHLVPVGPDGGLLRGGMWWDGGQVSQTLDAVLHKGQTMPEKNRFPAVLVPIAFSCKDYGADAMVNLAPTLRAMGHASSHANAGGQLAIVWGWRVRRLTERECERLQGMADDWTLVPFRGKPAAAGPRYKSIGNSMAVTVMRHIGRKIDAALMHEFFA